MKVATATGLAMNAVCEPSMVSVVAFIRCAMNRSASFAALTASPGARAFYDQHRASGHGHNDALRRLANRLVGILHGCLKTRTLYDEDTAWGHRQQQAA